MNNFKQIAGVIVLIFVLFVLYNIINDHLEEKRAEERAEKIRAEKAEMVRQYEECASSVTAIKTFDEGLARSVVEQSRTDGSFNRLMQNCIATTYTPKPSIFDNDEDNFYANMQRMTEQKCEVDAVMNILSPLRLTPEAMESKYNAGIMDCESKYKSNDYKNF